MNILIAITGASGTIYARQLIERLSGQKEHNISLVFSKHGIEVAKYEGEYEKIISLGVTIYDNSNMFSTVASGSSLLDAMVIVPSTASTLSKIANGISDNLLTRAADVILKERRVLIVALRETPLSLIQIENMRRVTMAGAIVMPLSPSFYSLPTNIEELVTTQTDRILSLLKIDTPRYVWK